MHNNIYNDFAKIYDNLMSEVDYNSWADYIEKIWTKFSKDVNLVLDLACGTANLSNILAKRGYDLIAIDKSIEMLNIAKNKNKDILFLNQDMCEFELFGTVDSIISTCDSLNYLLEYDDLLETFKLVENYLNPGGLFIFDLNTEFYFKEILSNNTFAENIGEISYIWENYYFEKEKINEYKNTFFIHNDNNMYEKFEETHFERAYSVDEISFALKKNKLKLLGVYEAFSFNEYKNSSERICYIAKKV